MPRGVLKQPVQKQCAHCGDAFAATNAAARYCSARCNFEFYVGAPDGNGCWPWTGPRADRHGYGSFDGRGYASRAAWVFAFGPIPKGLYVCHACDNPVCVNPKHLMLGTNTANIIDRTRKGRQAKGERAPRAKLSESDVIAIRADLRRGEETLAIAARFGVDKSQVSRIARGETWAHLRENGEPFQPIPLKTRFKLDYDTAEAIRASFTGKPGEISALARKYDLSFAAMRSVISGKHYPPRGRAA